MDTPLKVFSLFTGIGGFELGITQALGTDNVEFVGYSEIDKYAIKIYASNYPTHHNFGDVSKLQSSDIPDFDLLVGGSPCQSFSVAGKREGMEGKSSLVSEYIRVLQTKKPSHFIWENVPGMLTIDGGKTFTNILQAFDEAGYFLQWNTANSKDYGVPQNRNRFFVVGTRKDRQLKLLSFQRPNKSALDYVGAVMSAKNKKWINDSTCYSRTYPQGQRVYRVTGIACTLTSQGGGLGAKTGLYYENKDAIRRLSPVECARLQGFPDGWHKDSLVSDTQLYKCYGNAVTVNVIEHIVRGLYNGV
jgi:DNA (cytosine-5)-methyltransferase 1